MSLSQELRAELGLDWKDMPSTDVHKVADREHSDMIWSVFERYVTDEKSYGLVIQGARALWRSTGPTASLWRLPWKESSRKKGGEFYVCRISYQGDGHAGADAILGKRRGR